MRTHYTAVVALVLVVCVVAAAGRAQGGLLFEDDFERSLPTPIGYIGLWDGPPDPTVMYLTDSTSHSGGRSVELRYVPGTFGASFMYRHFPGQDVIYHRWYQKWSPGFVWEPSATKMLILRPERGYPEFYPEVLWANGQLAIQAQVVQEANWDAENFYQNQGEPTVFQTDRWYCLEVYVKLNTPGAADGEVAAWIDGDLKLAYAGRQFRGATPLDPGPSTAKIEAVAATGYYGGVTQVPQLQFSWQDDHAASTERIGCKPVSDDFERSRAEAAGTIRGWDGPGNPAAIYLTDNVAHSGTRSMELKYDQDSVGAGYMFKHFTGQDDVYYRWYQQWSDGFRWAPSGTDMIGLGPYDGYPQLYAFVFGDTGEFALQAELVAEAGWDDENFRQNQGTPLVLQPQHWYCMEVHFKLNTPGVADGEVAAWIDGDLKLLYTGRQFRGATPTDPAPSTARVESAYIAGGYSGATVPQLQYAWHDDHVVSSRPIGCLVDTTPYVTGLPLP